MKWQIKSEKNLFFLFFILQCLDINGLTHYCRIKIQSTSLIQKTVLTGKLGETLKRDKINARP